MRSLLVALLIVGFSTPSASAAALLGLKKKQARGTVQVTNYCDEVVIITLERAGTVIGASIPLEPDENRPFTVDDIPFDGVSMKLIVNSDDSLNFTLEPSTTRVFGVFCDGSIVENPEQTASTAPLREFGVLASAMTGLCCLGFIGSFFGRAPRSEDDENASPVDDLDAK